MTPAQLPIPESAPCCGTGLTWLCREVLRRSGMEDCCDACPLATGAPLPLAAGQRVAVQACRSLLLSATGPAPHEIATAMEPRALLVLGLYYIQVASGCDRGFADLL